MELIITESLSSWGYYGIFLFFVIGCFGPPIPDEILLIVLGYLTFGGAFEFFLVLLVVISGSLGGIVVDYLVGRLCLYSARLAQFRWFRALEPGMRRGQDLVKRCGPGIALGSYFLPGVRHWVPVAAGLMKAPPVSLTCGAGLGAVLWSAAYLYLGYFLAQKGAALPASLSPGPYLAIPGGLLILGMIWLAARKFRGEKSAGVTTEI